jgi:CheY-like chemotaxis protein
VTDARDGQEGVALAAAGAFDLILMDISMPRMDGVTASRKIRESGGPNSDTPIVALTAHALPADITRFRDAGMVDVVTKPLSRDRLAAVLRDTGSLKDGPVSEHGWARRELIATLGSEQAEIVISRVREEIAAGARSLREMASSADAEEISSLAHKLAGSAALAGFDAVHTRLKDVELRSRTMDISELNATLSEIASLLDVE